MNDSWTGRTVSIEDGAFADEEDDVEVMRKRSEEQQKIKPKWLIRDEDHDDESGSKEQRKKSEGKEKDTTSENGRVTSTSRVDADALADELYEIQIRFHRSVDSLRDLVEANRSTLKHVEAMLVQSLDEKSNNAAQSRISSRRSSIAMLTRRKSGSPLPSLARRSSMSSPHHQNQNARKNTP